MKRSKLYEIILIIIGMLTYSMGTCMYLKEDWNLRNAGIVISIIGIILIGIFIAIHSKNKVVMYKEKTKKDKIFRLIGINGVLLFTVGLILMFATVWFSIGVILGVVGLLIIILNYSIYNYKETIRDLKKIFKDKKTYINILNFIGTNLFAFGMALTIIETWNLVIVGTIIGIIGIAILIFDFYINGKDEKKKEYYVIDLRDVISVFVGFIGAFFISLGLMKVVEFTNKIILIFGLVCNYIGFLLCVLNIPINRYLKKNEIYDKKLKINLYDKKHTYSVKNLWLMFVIYGFLGWCVEFVVCGAYKGDFINRGFLHITLLPVWGLGGMIVTLIFSKSQRFVFTKSLIYLSLLEYITSILLEYIFNNKWWDYTNNPFNLNGRICLFNCLAFGIFGLIFSKYISPLINKKLNKISNKKINYIVAVTSVIFVADLLISLFYPNRGIGITS